MLILVLVGPVYVAGVSEASTILASATLGQEGQISGGWAVYQPPAAQFLGWRFYVTTPIQVREVGAHIYDPNQNKVFFALLRIDEASGLPVNLTPSGFLAVTTVQAPLTSHEVRASLSASLAPGWYGFLVGSGGDYGAPGNSAALTGNNPDLPDQAGSYFGWNGTSWFSNGSSLMARFVVAGTATCGNGVKDEAEQCDDGNLEDSDGCDARCQLEQIVVTPTVTATPTPTATATSPGPPPIFSDAARACQGSIARESRKVSATEHDLWQKCFDRILTSRAKGKGEARAIVACAKALDPATASLLSRAQSKAKAHIAMNCSGISATDLDSPCVDGATTIAEVTNCVFTQSAASVEQVVIAEYRDSCALVTAAGLAVTFPKLCGDR